MRRFSTIGIALAVVAVAVPAAAEPAPDKRPPDKEVCVASFDRGQRAQSDRALRRALGELIVCAQESCPNVLRADCAGVLAEVRAALPTIVFAADDGNGHELTDVRVFAGGELVATSLDGRAIPLDPGTFELRFERAGQPPLVTTRTVREGEKSRVVRVSLGGRAGAERADRSGGAKQRSALGWALPGSLAAVGVAGLATSLFTRLHFNSRVDGLRTSCAPQCTPDQRDQLSGIVVTSNIALGIGLGALALAVATWVLTTPATTSSTTATTAPASSASSFGRWTW